MSSSPGTIGRPETSAGDCPGAKSTELAAGAGWFPLAVAPSGMPANQGSAVPGKVTVTLVEAGEENDEMLQISAADRLKNSVFIRYALIRITPYLADCCSK